MPKVSTYSAALIAGGKSSRMGKDKALLPMPRTGELLWQRQLRTLNELRPGELFYSGPKRNEMPERAQIVRDRVPNAGPLAGIDACLHATRSDLLIVIAVDMPRMTSIYLARILAQCSSDRGAVAKRDGFFEPLAAVYPKRLGLIAAEHLRVGKYALQDFVRAGIECGMMESFVPSPEDEALFQNVNSPDDL